MKTLISIILLGAAGFAGYAYNNSKSTSPNQMMAMNYDGAWNVAIIPTSGGQCASASALVQVQNGFITGILRTTDGVTASLAATIDAQGVMRNGASSNLGSFDGSIAGGVGSGVWSDKYGCAGSFTMRRAEAMTNTGEYMAPQAPSSRPAQTQTTQTAPSSDSTYVGGGAVGEINCKVSGIGCSKSTQTTTYTNTTVTPKKTTTTTTNTTATPAPAPAAVTYNGTWNGTATVTGGSDADRCSITNVSFTISNNSSLSGAFTTSLIGNQPVRGSVTSTGAISGYGGFVGFTGNLSGNTGFGNWKGGGNLDCYGTFSVSR